MKLLLSSGLHIHSKRLTLLIVNERDAREAKRGGTAPGEQRVSKQAQGPSQVAGAALEKYDLSKIYAANPPRIQKINIASPNLKNMSNSTLQNDSS
jgi:hypothetical protein